LVKNAEKKIDYLENFYFYHMKKAKKYRLKRVYYFELSDFQGVTIVPKTWDGVLFPHNLALPLVKYKIPVNLCLN